MVPLPIAPCLGLAVSFNMAEGWQGASHSHFIRVGQDKGDALSKRSHRLGFSHTGKLFCSHEVVSARGISGEPE